MLEKWGKLRETFWSKEPNISKNSLKIARKLLFSQRHTCQRDFNINKKIIIAKGKCFSSHTR